MAIPAGFAWYVTYSIWAVVIGVFVWLWFESYKIVGARRSLIMISLLISLFILLMGGTLLFISTSVGLTFITFVPDHPMSIYYMFSVGLASLYWLSGREALALKIRVPYLILYALLFLALYFSLWISPPSGNSAYYEGGKIKFSTLAGFLIAYGTSLFVVSSSAMERGLARYLTRRRGEKWTKEIDYIYLGSGVIGVIMSLNRISEVSKGFEGSDIIAPVLIMTALVVRLIKTRAEIAGWNKIK